MKRYLIVVCIVFMFVLLHGCKFKKVMLNARIFDRTYTCDSISVPTYNFTFEDDSAMYSVMKKELFNFKMKIDRNYINLDGEEYHYFLAGLDIDTIGLINITENSYRYKQTKEKNESALLFDFNKKINDSWVIKEDGYFKNYEVRLAEVNYDELLRDSVYTFIYNFIGTRFPNGYYFEKFYISKRYGIMGYSLSNGVECRCVRNDGYEHKLKTTIKSIILEEKLTIEQIQRAIPKTEEEYFVFYSYTEKDGRYNEAFYELNNLIFKNAMSNEKGVFRLYLLLSEFVDGEYAESYFEDVEAVIIENMQSFCELFSQLPKKKVKRLLELHDKYCN